MAAAASGSQFVESREYTVTLTGRVPGTSVEKTLTKTVKQRNEPIYRKA